MDDLKFKLSEAKLLVEQVPPQYFHLCLQLVQEFVTETLRIVSKSRLAIVKYILMVEGNTSLVETERLSNSFLEYSDCLNLTANNLPVEQTSLDWQIKRIHKEAQHKYYTNGELQGENKLYAEMSILNLDLAPNFMARLSNDCASSSYTSNGSLTIQECDTNSKTGQKNSQMVVQTESLDDRIEQITNASTNHVCVDGKESRMQVEIYARVGEQNKICEPVGEQDKMCDKFREQKEKYETVGEQKKMCDEAKVQVKMCAGVQELDEICEAVVVRDEQCEDAKEQDKICEEVGKRDKMFTKIVQQNEVCTKVGEQDDICEDVWERNEIFEDAGEQDKACKKIGEQDEMCEGIAEQDKMSECDEIIDHVINMEEEQKKVNNQCNKNTAEYSSCDEMWNIVTTEDEKATVSSDAIDSDSCVDLQAKCAENQGSQETSMRNEDKRTSICLLCTDSNEEYKTKTDFIEHCLRVHCAEQADGKWIISCVLCGKVFKLKSSKPKGCTPNILACVSHLVLKHNLPIPRFLSWLKCSYNACNYSTLSRYNLVSHCKAHKKKNIVCKSCQKTISSTSFTEHNKVCSGSEKYVCSECGGTFTQLGNLRNHIKNVHEKVVRFQCPECSSKFFAKTDMVRHAYRKHGIKLTTHPLLKCSQCSFIATDSAQMNSHKRSHDTGEHSCDVCGKVFSTAKRKQTHMKSHKEKRFKCKQCSYATTKASHLERHQVVHSVNLKCSRKGCNFVALHSRALQSHKRAHESIRNEASTVEEPSNDQVDNITIPHKQIISAFTVPNTAHQGFTVGQDIAFGDTTSIVEKSEPFVVTDGTQDIVVKHNTTNPAIRIGSSSGIVQDAFTANSETPSLDEISQISYELDRQYYFSKDQNVDEISTNYANNYTNLNSSDVLYPKTNASLLLSEMCQSNKTLIENADITDFDSIPSANDIGFSSKHQLVKTSDVDMQTIVRFPMNNDEDIQAALGLSSIDSNINRTPSKDINSLRYDQNADDIFSVSHILPMRAHKRNDSFAVLDSNEVPLQLDSVLENEIPKSFMHASPTPSDVLTSACTESPFMPNVTLEDDFTQQSLLAWPDNKTFNTPTPTNTAPKTCMNSS